MPTFCCSGCWVLVDPAYEGDQTWQLCWNWAWFLSFLPNAPASILGSTIAPFTKTQLDRTVVPKTQGLPQNLLALRKTRRSVHRLI